MTTNDTIGVLLADTQDLVRSGFSLALREEPGIDVVAEANSGELVMALAERYRPDVIIMDIWMPEASGGVKIIQNVQQMASGDRPGVIVLTSFQDDQYLFRSLQAGASGFLLKGASRRELVEAVRQVASGNAVLCPEMTRRLIDRFEFRPTRALAARGRTAIDRLSRRELQVLRCVAAASSNQEIAAELYLTPATVKSHVSNLLSKLELRDRMQLALFAYETGLVAPADAEYDWMTGSDPVLSNGAGWA